MVKVITYGTYDLLHYGHIRLLERAKALGDYLVVGVTSDDYDKVRGKINNQQSLMERIEAVKATGLADEVIVEEYDGQKIDDIKRYGIDIFTVGSDWEGKFDYLESYCKVIYLPRTAGISSSEIRASQRNMVIGVVGEPRIAEKFINESKFVNGVEAILFEGDYSAVNAMYIVSSGSSRFYDAKQALLNGKHVLCESPVAFGGENAKELLTLAERKKLIFMEGIKTAYSTALQRLLLLAKSGKIGRVLCVDTTCTSMVEQLNCEGVQGSFCDWGPTALFPVFELFGTQYRKREFVVNYNNSKKDRFTKINLTYGTATASVKVAKSAKSEGELIITGTEGYIYVPAPWWKTDYFELRFENPANNRRYFYQLEGNGIRYEIVAFANQINKGLNSNRIPTDYTIALSNLMYDFYSKKDVIEI